MPFSLLSFSIPAQLTLFLSLLWPTSATYCYNWVIILMISATSCWVKWRETLVWVWIKCRHWHKDRLLVQTMENASLNRLWLNWWWLKFHCRQEDNYCFFFPEVEVQLSLPEFSLLFSRSVNPVLLFSSCWFDLCNCIPTFALWKNTFPLFLSFLSMKRTNKLDTFH